MTGNLKLQGDSRMHFIIADANGSSRAYIFKDKGGDGVYINNGYDGGGEFIFHKDGAFRSPGSVYAGSSRIAPDGNIWGTRWNASGQWIWDAISGQFATRDNNINARATIDWVRQNFVQNIDLTAPQTIQFWDGSGYPRATDGAAIYNFSMVGGSSNVGWIEVRYTRKLINDVWNVIN